LIRPTLTVADARAEVVAVRRQTPRSVTLTLAPNAAWGGFAAGQYVAVGVEIDGVRRTRTYSPAGSARHGRALELTVTEHPGGLVSGHLLRAARPGAVVHLAPAQGAFTLSEPRPERVVLISGGSGITPVLSMLRTLLDEGHDGEIAFLHFARTEADWLYEPEVRALAAHPRVRIGYAATRGRDPRRLDERALRELIGDVAGASAAVCGPPSLVDAAPGVWTSVGGDPDRLLAETFTPPRLLVSGDAATGTVRFLRSDRTAPIADGTLLEQAGAAAGLSPEFGCRMGVCHTCTCRKAAGAVRNLRTGAIFAEENEDIQLCISAPVGDVTLEL
jgi:stearoyl-CoA 9-desaturase NADPH oxidoreductase